MIVISSLREVSPSRPVTGAVSDSKQIQRHKPLTSSRGEGNTLPASLRNNNSLNRLNRSSMNPAPDWEFSIRGMNSPETRCKKLVHLRKSGISKHKSRGLVPSPIKRSSISPSELNMLKQSHQKHINCNISVSASISSERAFKDDRCALIDRFQSPVSPVSRNNYRNALRNTRKNRRHMHSDDRSLAEKSEMSDDVFLDEDL